MDLFARFDPELRLNLKLSATRLLMNKNKKLAEISRQKTEIAALLNDPSKEELARIRTEHFVRDDRLVEVFGVLELLCQLMQERTKLLATLTEVPYDMRETCATICYAADRVDDVPELAKVKRQLVLKFGKGLTAMLDTDAAQRENVNERVFQKLSIKPPSALVVTGYMREIAKEKCVAWSPSVPEPTLQDSDAAWEDAMPAPTGAGSRGAFPDMHIPTKASKGGHDDHGGGGSAVSPGSRAKQPPAASSSVASTSTDKSKSAKQQSAKTQKGNAGAAGAGGTAPSQAQTFPGMTPAGGASPDEDAAAYRPVGDGAAAVPDFDELSRRFEALKGGG